MRNRETSLHALAPQRVSASTYTEPTRLIWVHTPFLPLITILIEA